MNFENPDVNNADAVEKQHASSGKKLGKIARTLVAMGLLSVSTEAEAFKGYVEEGGKETTITSPVEVKTPDPIADYKLNAPTNYEKNVPAPEATINTPSPVSTPELKTPTEYERKTPSPAPERRPLDDNFKM
jgi:hypothetical protein